MGAVYVVLDANVIHGKNFWEPEEVTALLNFCGGKGVKICITECVWKEWLTALREKFQTTPIEELPNHYVNGPGITEQLELGVMFEKAVAVNETYMIENSIEILGFVTTPPRLREIFDLALSQKTSHKGQTFHHALKTLAVDELAAKQPDAMFYILSLDDQLKNPYSAKNVEVVTFQNLEAKLKKSFVQKRG